MSSELLLIIAIIAFYLFDSAILLYSNEVLLTESSGKWKLLCPNNNIFILNKLFYMPNPLIPINPLFRLYWTNMEAESEFISNNLLNNFIRVLIPLKLLTAILFSFLIFGVPIILTKFGSRHEFIILLIAIYANILSIIIYIGLNRGKFNLSLKKYIFIIFESFVCAPYAINLVRKLSLNHMPSGSSFKSICNTLNIDTFESLKNSLLVYLDNKIILENDAENLVKLKKQRQSIIEL